MRLRDTVALTSIVAIVWYVLVFSNFGSVRWILLIPLGFLALFIVLPVVVPGLIRPGWRRARQSAARGRWKREIQTAPERYRVNVRPESVRVVNADERTGTVLAGGKARIGDVNLAMREFLLRIGSAIAWSAIANDGEWIATTDALCYTAGNGTLLGVLPWTELASVTARVTVAGAARVRVVASDGRSAELLVSRSDASALDAIAFNHGVR